MKINSRSLILMAIVGMSSTHLMESKSVSPVNNTRSGGSNGKASSNQSVMSTANSVINPTNSSAHIPVAQLISFSNSNVPIHKLGTIRTSSKKTPTEISYQESLIAKSGEYVAPLTATNVQAAPGSIGQRVADAIGYNKNAAKQRSEYNSQSPSNPFNSAASGWNFTTVRQDIYNAPGRALGGKLGLNREGQIISGKDGSAMSAAIAAKEIISSKLKSIKATMTPTQTQKAAVERVYQNAVTSIKSTASWTNKKFNEFRTRINEQVSQIFGKNKSSELVIHQLNIAEPFISNVLNHPDINGRTFSEKGLKALANRSKSAQARNESLNREISNTTESVAEYNKSQVMKELTKTQKAKEKVAQEKVAQEKAPEKAQKIEAQKLEAQKLEAQKIKAQKIKAQKIEAQKLD